MNARDQQAMNMHSSESVGKTFKIELIIFLLSRASDDLK